MRKTEYAVRGALPIRVHQIDQEISAGDHDYQFNATVQCNIGNPQQLKQQPITFFRQVAALVDCPSLLNGDKDALQKLFPNDAIERAELLVKEVSLLFVCLTLNHLNINSHV